MEDHPEYRLTYWHLQRETSPESLWFYCVEDISERLFDHCRQLADGEMLTFCVEAWDDDDECRAIVVHGKPRNVLAFYGWPANLALRLSRAKP